MAAFGSSTREYLSVPVSTCALLRGLLRTIGRVPSVGEPGSMPLRGTSDQHAAPLDQQGEINHVDSGMASSPAGPVHHRTGVTNSDAVNPSAPMNVHCVSLSVGNEGALSRIMIWTLVLLLPFAVTI